MIDYQAWQPPEPPDGLADAVIARMETPSPKKRPWLFVAGALVGAAIIAAAVFATRGDEDRPSRGVIAESHGTIDDIDVALDPGARVSWHRDRDRIVVDDLVGNVTWRVPDGDRLHITLREIDATNSHFRTEIKMNGSDARVVGTSAVIAAAVSLVTVIVYEGHVRATHEGHTVEIVQGSTVQLPVPMPVPVPVPTKTDDNVGMAPTTPPPPKPVAKGDCQPASAVDPFDPRPVCDGTPKQDTTKTVPCDPEPGRLAGDDDFAKKNWAAAIVGYENALKCGPDAAIAKRAGIAACHAHNDAKAKKFYLLATDRNEIVDTCILNNIHLEKPKYDQTKPPDPDGCDYKDLFAKGSAALGANQDVAALNFFEKAYACTADPNAAVLATISACKSGNASKAKLWFSRLPASKQSMPEGRCAALKVPLR